MSNPTTQAYTELQEAYDHYNSTLFEGGLPFCLITLQREGRAYGYFSSKRFVHRFEKITTDEIAINPSYFAVVPLLEVLQTIVHEMVHLWQFHFGDPGRRGYHNKEWAAKMEAIGLMPSHTGSPGGRKTGERMADYAIEGGAFMGATQVLLDRDFRISWLDRYPPAGLLTSGATAMHGNVEPYIEDSSPGAPYTENIGMMSHVFDDVDGLVQPQGTRDRSNRVKYRCSQCESQVWGKPGLLILCGQINCGHSEFTVV